MASTVNDLKAIRERKVFSQVEFGTPQFDQLLDLRTRLLRIPLSIEFHVKDIQQEWAEYHFGLYTMKHELLACLSMKRISFEEVKMRQVAVEVEQQGKGYGQKLVKEVEQWCRNEGFAKISLHARDTAVPFYDKMNYKTVGDEFFEVNIAHYKMEKAL